MPIVPWGAKPGSGGGGGSVSSVSNADGTLTISPTTGSVVASIAISTALPGSPTTTTQSAGDNSTKIATDAFVTTAINNAISGVNPAVAVQAATTTAGDTSALTYNNGVSGIGATFTGTLNTAIAFDGHTLLLNDRVLVKNDTQSPSGAFNGIYLVTTIQSIGVAPILTRASDYNQPSDINSTGAIPVILGTVNASTSWVQTAQVVTVGTTPLSFTQFTLNPTTIATSANNLSFFASTTSAQLAGVISNETGSGALVFGTSPTLTTPVFSSIVNSGTLTLPTSSDTLVGRATTDTLTNKRITKRVTALSANSATPTINTDNCDVVHITAQTAAITSFTTNLAGTPVDGDVLRISVTGTTSVALTFGTSFEASTVALPTTTASTARLDMGFFWNTETSKWRCVAVA